MQIKNDQLVPVAGSIELAQTPNMGGVIVPEYLVIHYTAGRSGASAVEHFESAAAKASAHIVLDRSGKIWQLVPFNRRAWHAGVSSWAGRHDLNGCSIGIELDNAGRLEKRAHKYQAWFGGLYDEADVIQARHKNETAAAYWHAYTEVQLSTLLVLGKLLVAQYPLKDVLGHDDIAPGRKSDPGPAFALGSFRATLFGRGEESSADYLVNVKALNLRGGPGVEHPVIALLESGARLKLLEMRALWARVVMREGAELEGWVRNSFISQGSKSRRAKRAKRGKSGALG
jgi:N-acetylmuramoyl-L-alanine amidase